MTNESDWHKKMLSLKFFAAVLSVLCFISICSAEDFVGKCVAVTDGDTIKVLHGGIEEKIRLDGIDAPESHQDFGTQAKNAMSTLVFGKDVKVLDHGKDKYGRTLGIVIVQPSGIVANTTMVRSGFAWMYRQYTNNATLAKSEELARSEKRGLWSMPNPIAPWDFRHGTGQANPATVAATQIDPFAQPTTDTQAQIVTPSEAASVPQVPAEAVTQSNTATQAKVQTQSQTVYVTNTGKCYHLAGCSGLRKSMIPMSLDDAAKSYRPCSICKPPQVSEQSASAGSTLESATSQVQAAPAQANIYNGTPSGDTTATGLPIYTGPRGGRYHISASGKKVYERRK